LQGHAIQFSAGNWSSSINRSFSGLLFALQPGIIWLNADLIG
jgi:hypothetical protein